MPLVGGAIGNPYCTINDVMNSARARLNDMINDTAGDLLTNDAPYAQTYLSDAWDWVKEQYATVGISTLKSEVTLFGVPARAGDDVAYQSWVTWQGCSDGVNQYDGPVLPQDLIQPLSTWRRESGSTGQFQPMTHAQNGLPRSLDPNVVDWRTNGMYFYGSQVAQDILIRYDGALPDLDITIPSAQIPMVGVRNMLGARIAFEFANARGAQGAATLEALADKFFQDGPAKLSSRRGQRGVIQRMPYGGRRRGGYNQIPYYTN